MNKIEDLRRQKAEIAMGIFNKKKQSGPEAAIADADLLILISAAIAAYESGIGAPANLVVRKISRIAGSVPAWGVEGNRYTRKDGKNEKI